MIVIDCKAPWILELAWLGALLSELVHEREPIVAREYLHSMIVAIGDEQETSMMVERQTSREVEQTISIALLAGADREQLDSRSIAINRIVSHPLRLNPTHAQPRRETLEASNQEMALTRLKQPRERYRRNQATKQQQDERRKQEQHHTQAPNAHTREPLVLDTSC